jgi:hypothetical protein
MLVLFLTSFVFHITKKETTSYTSQTYTNSFFDPGQKLIRYSDECILINVLYSDNMTIDIFIRSIGNIVFLSFSCISTRVWLSISGENNNFF